MPAYVAYSKWMRFEKHPRFMDGVKEVKRLDVKRFLWKAIIAGRDTEWEGEITEQKADQRLVLTTRGGPMKGISATFRELSNSSSTVILHIEYDPQDDIKQARESLEMASSRIQKDLDRFKGYLEKGWVKPGTDTIFGNFPM